MYNADSRYSWQASHQALSQAVSRFPRLHHTAPRASMDSFADAGRAVVLADFGADVVRVDKAGTSFNVDVLSRRVSTPSFPWKGC